LGGGRPPGGRHHHGVAAPQRADVRPAVPPGIPLYTPWSRFARPVPGDRPMSQGITYVEGQVVDLAKASVPLNDRGYLLGDGVFETLRTSNGRIFRLDEHAARMRKGLTAINLDTSLEPEFR